MNNNVPRGFARHFSNYSLSKDEPRSERQERWDRRKKYFCSFVKPKRIPNGEGVLPYMDLPSTCPM